MVQRKFCEAENNSVFLWLFSFCSLIFSVSYPFFLSNSQSFTCHKGPSFTISFCFRVSLQTSNAVLHSYLPNGPPLFIAPTYRRPLYFLELILLPHRCTGGGHDVVRQQLQLRLYALFFGRVGVATKRANGGRCVNVCPAARAPLFVRLLPFPALFNRGHASAFAFLVYQRPFSVIPVAAEPLTIPPMVKDVKKLLSGVDAATAPDYLQPQRDRYRRPQDLYSLQCRKIKTCRQNASVYHYFKIAALPLLKYRFPLPAVLCIRRRPVVITLQIPLVSGCFTGVVTLRGLWLRHGRGQEFSRYSGRVELLAGPNNVLDITAKNKVSRACRVCFVCLDCALIVLWAVKRFKHFVFVVVVAPAIQLIS